MEIEGVDTKPEQIRVDIDYAYPQVLIGDDYDTIPFDSFTFSEVQGITYDLEYDSYEDVFVLYRNFSYASGVSIIALLALVIIIFNLVLMLARVFKEKRIVITQSRFNVTPTQRLINVL